jgi:hypothetical protein
VEAYIERNAGDWSRKQCAVTHKQQVPGMSRGPFRLQNLRTLRRIKPASDEDRTLRVRAMSGTEKTARPGRN